MNLQITPFQEYTLVSVEGRIDTTNFSEFEKPIMTLIEGGCSKIILDCSGLNYISSSGLRVFLIIQKKMKADKGNFILCSLQPGIKEIFDISGFSTIFPIFPDKESAIMG